MPLRFCALPCSVMIWLSLTTLLPAINCPHSTQPPAPPLIFLCGLISCIHFPKQPISLFALTNMIPRLNCPSQKPQKFLKQDSKPTTASSSRIGGGFLRVRRKEGASVFFFEEVCAHVFGACEADGGVEWVRREPLGWWLPHVKCP